MDAVKFLEEWKRMHKNGRSVPALDANIDFNSEKVVKLVDEWSAAHTRKTRQSVFLEQWPGAELVNGCLAICPKRISANYRNGNADCTNRLCADCLYKFWMQDVESWKNCCKTSPVVCGSCWACTVSSC